MIATDSPLEAAFTDDHRRFTRGLSRILAALKKDDLPSAIGLAEELDRAVGAHIQFEEEVFYPEVAKKMGREYTSQLYQEHRIGQRALRALLARPRGSPLAPGDRDELIAQFETALEHALSCGTLLSHITGRDAAEQERMLARLRELEERGHRWTELPVRRRRSAE